MAQHGTKEQCRAKDEWYCARFRSGKVQKLRAVQGNGTVQCKGLEQYKNLMPQVCSTNTIVYNQCKPKNNMKTYISKQSLLRNLFFYLVILTVLSQLMMANFYIYIATTSNMSKQLKQLVKLNLLQTIGKNIFLTICFLLSKFCFSIPVLSATGKYLQQQHLVCNTKTYCDE